MSVVSLFSAQAVAWLTPECLRALFFRSSNQPSCRSGANPLRRVARLAGWIVLLSAGALVGRYWQELLLRALATFGKVMALFGA